MKPEARTEIRSIKECDRANGLMMKYMDGELSEKEAEALREHIAGCPGCKADFEMYDFINDELTNEAGLTPAPEGFTQSVMKMVAALPSTKKIAASNFDRVMCAVWGVFSLLFGIGFLLVLNREQIIEYLSGIPALQRYINAVSPSSSAVSEVLTGAVDSAYSAFVSAVSFVSSYHYVVLGVFVALVASQIILSRRKAVAGEKAKIR